MIRVVVDANVFVSAIIKPDSIPGKIIDLIGQGLVRLVISREIMAEIRQVLLYPKIKKLHRLTPKLIDQALAEISEAATVTPGVIQRNGVEDGLMPVFSLVLSGELKPLVGLSPGALSSSCPKAAVIPNGCGLGNQGLPCSVNLAHGTSG